MKKIAWISVLSTALIFSACQGRDKRSTEEVQSFKVLESCISWDGDTLPRYPEGQPKISLLHITVAPHAQLNMHKHPIINVGYLIQGELTVTSKDGKSNTIHAGDGIIEVVDKYHYGTNTGDVPAELVVFYAGDQESPLSIAE